MITELSDIVLSLANANAEDLSWTQIGLLVGGMVIGGVFTYFIGKFEKETSGEIAEARKEGYDAGRNVGTEEGMKTYRNAMNAVLDEHNAKVCYVNKKGAVNSIRTDAFLADVDDAAEYESL